MNSRVAAWRTIRLILLLGDGKPHHLSDLAKRLEVSERTVRRYLDNLPELPITLNKSWVQMEPPAPLQALPLTVGEALVTSLALNQAHLTGLDQIVWDHQWESLLTKLQALLPPKLNEALEYAKQAVTIRSGPRLLQAVHPQFLEIIRDAILHTYCLNLRYRDASGEETQRKVEPWELAFHEGGYYLIGYCHLRQDQREFRVDRILEVEPLKEESFLLPEQFLHPLDQSWGVEIGRAFDAVLLFDKQIAGFIAERKWHASQQIKRQEDGTLQLHVHTNSLIELKQWILSFGSHVCVLRPVWLQKQIEKQLQEALAQYARPTYRYATRHSESQALQKHEEAMQQPSS
ncbi:MAG: WYL domain-containing transcriptional regulator [Firmicutes bacterium]|nr:WYL domain-containing transcriptional regulator [Bacillota bacterium]